MGLSYLLNYSVEISFLNNINSNTASHFTRTFDLIYVYFTYINFYITSPLLRLARLFNKTNSDNNLELNSL